MINQSTLGNVSGRVRVLVIAVLAASCALITFTTAPAQADDFPPRFAVDRFTATAFKADNPGEEVTGTEVPMPASGSHDDLKVEMDFDNAIGDRVAFGFNVGDDDTPKTLKMTMPPYLLGNPNAAPKCGTEQYKNNDCGDESKIGLSVITTRIAVYVPIHVWIPRIWAPAIDVKADIFNLEPEGSDLATFGITVRGLNMQIKSHVRIENSDSHRIVTTIDDIPHDWMIIQKMKVLLRGTHDGKPFLTMPTACDDWSKMDVHAKAYNGREDSASDPLRDESCEPDTSTTFKSFKKSEFNPKVPEFAGDNKVVDQPAAYSMTMQLPREPGDFGYNNDQAQSAVKDINLAMQPGLRMSPGVVGLDGKDLVDCPMVQFKHWDQDTPNECPAKSEVGQVAIRSGELGEVPGKLYLGWAQKRGEQEGGGIMMRVWLEAGTPWGAKAEDTKFRLKTWGEITVDPSGQIRASFKDVEPLPWREMSMKFVTGAGKNVLVNPPDCDPGNNVTEVAMHPWTNVGLSDPGTMFATSQVRPEWDKKFGTGGVCPATRPFEPKIQATLSSHGKGVATAMELNIERGKYEDSIKGMQLHLADGMFPSVPATLCTMDQVKNQTCNRRVGSVSTQVGFGDDLTTIKGESYLVEPVGANAARIVTALKANVGPIDLGYEYVSMNVHIDQVLPAFKVSINADQLPTRVNGIDAPIRQMTFKIDDPSALTTPPDCGDWNFRADFTGTRGTTSSAVSTVKGCS